MLKPIFLTALLLASLGMAQKPQPAVYDGWVSAKRVSDTKTYQAIFDTLNTLHLPRGPLVRDHAHWLIGITMSKKPYIVKELKRRGFRDKVVFIDDPLPKK